MTIPSQFLTRTLALGTLTVLAATAWFAVFAPLRVWHAEMLRQADDKRLAIERLDQSLAVLAQERAALKSSLDASLIWQADQSGQASALVQSNLSEIAREAGLSLRSVSPLSPRNVPLAQGIGFRVELEAPLDRLVSYLVEIEHSQPALSIDRATLRRLVRPAMEQDQVSRLPELFVQLDILAPVQLATPAPETTP
jgi:hypothetical protein